MPIKVQCACGRSMLVKDELAGKLARCPDCKQPVRVPGGGGTVEPEYLDEEDDRSARRPRRVNRSIERFFPHRFRRPISNEPRGATASFSTALPLSACCSCCHASMPPPTDTVVSA